MTSGPIFFPARIPEAIRANKRRGAECRVYDTLCAQLAGPWHVYYSRPWLGLDRDGRDKDGEADFVLAHPEYGMLVLEVKGGGIRYDAVHDKWTSTNSDHETVKIKNPATQATTNKHELLKKLKKRAGWGGRYINARIGVVFPDCKVPHDLAPNLPRYSVAGVIEMQKLGSWVEQRLIGNDEALENVAPPGQDGLAIMDGFFAESFQLEQPMAASLLQADHELRIMTERQALVLQLLEQHRRLAIPGAAGTGKTALAVEKARRLATQGMRTLLLCYNRPLAVHLRLQLGTIDNLEVSSFHALVRKLARRARLDVPDDSDARKLDGTWGRLLMEALEHLASERFDAIVVDEGQDLDEGWLPAVEMLLRDAQQGVLYVFYDDNQKVHARSTTIEAAVHRSDIHLNRVLRNTRPIAESYRALLPASVMIDGPEGPPVEYREFGGSLADELTKLLSDLIESRCIAPERIAVLFRDVATRDSVLGGRAIGRWCTTDAEKNESGRVICESVRRFKGLEAPVVILVEPSTYCEETEMLYVGMSRPRTLLILLDKSDGLRQIRGALEASRSA